MLRGIAHLDKSTCKFLGLITKVLQGRFNRMIIHFVVVWNLDEAEGLVE